MHGPALMIFKVQNQPIFKSLIGVCYAKLHCFCHINGIVEMFCGEVVFIKNNPNLIEAAFTGFIFCPFHNTYRFACPSDFDDFGIG